MTNKATAVIVCAGSASRMNGVNKIFASVGGVPVIVRTLRAFDESECITDFVVVTRPEFCKTILDMCEEYGIKKPVTVCEGGADRAHSVLNGVMLSKSEFVAISDGARPLVDPRHIDRTCRAAFETGAAALGVKMTDTVKRVAGDVIKDTVDRTDLVRIQTPQVFERTRYLTLANEALKADHEFTDDCSVYEYFGEPITMVYGSVNNIKLTVPEDMELCERLVGNMKMPRVGHGYDVHRFAKDRELWLCGEKIEYEMGLDGHSDADVALHALTDALLGAAAMGDIGKLFPDTDMQYKGISSITLLEKVAKRVFEKYTFVNCDVTIIAQKPKLSPHIDKMRENIARALNTSAHNVSVKATTEERLGFTGRLEGISAHAVCCLY